MPKAKNTLHQNNRQVALICAHNIVDEFADQFPAAIKYFENEWENCLNHMGFPDGRPQHIRTTSLLERAFVAQRRWPKQLLSVPFMRGKCTQRRFRRYSIARNHCGSSAFCLSIDQAKLQQEIVSDVRVEMQTLEPQLFVQYLTESIAEVSWIC